MFKETIQTAFEEVEATMYMVMTRESRHVTPSHLLPQGSARVQLSGKLPQSLVRAFKAASATKFGAFSC